MTLDTMRTVVCASCSCVYADWFFLFCFVFLFLFFFFVFFCFFFCFFVFFFQAEDGIRDSDMWLEFRRVLFRSDARVLDPLSHKEKSTQLKGLTSKSIWKMKTLESLHPLKTQTERLNQAMALFFHNQAESPMTSTKFRRSEERRVGKECRSRWSP